MPVDELQARVLDAVDVDGLVATLCELIAFQSCGGDEVPAQRHMAKLLADAGMQTDVWDIDIAALQEHPDYGAEIERDGALGVVGRYGDGHGPSLILNGHIDVVPAGELGGWSVSPWQGTLRDGRVYGRGSADMKGGLCCALYAMRALRDAGVALAGSVSLQSVIGEEDGGIGTLAAIEHGCTADAAIVLEPTRLVVAPAQAGALSFRIRIPGRAAHGALRTEGVSPVEKLPLVYAALERLERARNRRLQHPLFAGCDMPYAICVGKVRAGIWASTVAESLVLEGRYGVALGEDCADARRELEQAVLASAHRDPWLREHPPVIEWWGARFEPAHIPSGHPLVTALAHALAMVTGQQPSICGMPYGADMRLLVNRAAIPTVIFGPGDVRQAHAPDEFVTVAELEIATRTLALMALRWCGISTGTPAHNAP